MKKPDFVVVGAVKSGTTSLFHYLRQHPAIFIPKSKEISYFSGSDSAGRVAERDEYLSFFSTAGAHQKIGEVATAYLYSENAAEAIADCLGRETKIVIMLRNPADMVYSLWGQNTRDGGETLPLVQALEAESQRMLDPDFSKDLSGWKYNYAYTDRGRYSPQVKRYLDVFGRDNVVIYIFEEFFADIESSMRDLFGFIGVDPDYQVRNTVQHNRQGRVRWQWLHRLYFENSRAAEVVRRIMPARYRRAIIMALYRLNTKTGPRVSLDEDLYMRLMRDFESDIHVLEKMLGRDLSFIWPFHVNAASGDLKQPFPVR